MSEPAVEATPVEARVPSSQAVEPVVEAPVVEQSPTEAVHGLLAIVEEGHKLGDRALQEAIDAVKAHFPKPAAPAEAPAEA